MSHNANLGMASASENFFLILESVGAKATHLPGAVCKLGSCMMAMVEGYKQINAQQEDWVCSIMSHDEWLSHLTCIFYLTFANR